MNRGSKCRPRISSETLSRFNEAPIHESGKFGDIGGADNLDSASMRPRFMNRGSLADLCVGRAADRVLQ